MVADLLLQDGHGWQCVFAASYIGSPFSLRREAGKEPANPSVAHTSARGIGFYSYLQLSLPLRRLLNFCSADCSLTIPLKIPKFLLQNLRQLILKKTPPPILLPRLPSQLSQSHSSGSRIQSNNSGRILPENICIQFLRQSPRLRFLDLARRMQTLADDSRDVKPGRLVVAGAFAEEVGVF